VLKFSHVDFASNKSWFRFKILLHRQGIYLAPSQYEAGFTSLAHTEEDIEKTIAAAKEVFAAL